MEIFLKTPRGTVYSIEVNSTDTVLEMKQKIEMSLGVPVSKQNIFFKGKILLKDDPTLKQLKIVDKTRLDFTYHSLYGPNRNISQVRRQTEQSSSVQSNSIPEMVNIQDSPEKAITNQDSTLMLRSNDDQIGPSSSGPSNSDGAMIYGEDWPFATANLSNVQSYWNYQMFQTERSLPSNPTEQRMDDQDLTARAGSSNQVVQTVKSQPSDSIKEVIDIPDSPVRCSNKPPQKLRVMVLPYTGESNAERFPVDVNADDDVEELRKELKKIQQRSHLNLPEEYFFLHKHGVLEDDQSFRCNGVSHGDTVEIFPGHVTRDGSGDAGV